MQPHREGSSSPKSSTTSRLQQKSKMMTSATRSNHYSVTTDSSTLNLPPSPQPKQEKKTKTKHQIHCIYSLLSWHSSRTKLLKSQTLFDPSTITPSQNSAIKHYLHSLFLRRNTCLTNAESSTISNQNSHLNFS